MQVVRILAPGDFFIYQAAQRIPDEKLPLMPGGAALEFVVAMERLKGRISNHGQGRHINFSNSRFFSCQERGHRGHQANRGHQRHQRHQSSQCHQCGSRFKSTEQPKSQLHHCETFETFETFETGLKGLPLKDALRIKSAEYWLKLGEPVEASMELKHLSATTRKHPWALRVMVLAVGALLDMGEMVAVQRLTTRQLTFATR